MEYRLGSLVVRAVLGWRSGVCGEYDPEFLRAEALVGEGLAGKGVKSGVCGVPTLELRCRTGVDKRRGGGVEGCRQMISRSEEQAITGWDGTIGRNRGEACFGSIATASVCAVATRR